MHLAQLNIGKPLYDLEDRRMAGFMNNISFINGEGERAQGFVWILKDETGGATGIETPWPDKIANLTVWETYEDFQHFVYQTVHKRFMDNRTKWFEEPKEPYFVMWWIEEGHIPTLDEAKERLDYLTKHGNSDFAFDWEYMQNTKTACQ